MAREDHGTLARTVDVDVDDADETMRRPDSLGIDMDDVGPTRGATASRASTMFRKMFAALEGNASHAAGR